MVPTLYDILRLTVQNIKEINQNPMKSNYPIIQTNDQSLIHEWTIIISNDMQNTKNPHFAFWDASEWLDHIIIVNRLIYASFRKFR